MNGTPRRAANSAATVDFPDPVTPMTTIRLGMISRPGRQAARSSARRCRRKGHAPPSSTVEVSGNAAIVDIAADGVAEDAPEEL